MKFKDESTFLNEAMDANPIKHAPKIQRFLKRIGLIRINGFRFVELFGGGGTNFTAIYERKGERALAKFFLTGPNKNESEKFHRELKMLKLSLSPQRHESYHVTPRLISEFKSRDRCVSGYLMEFVSGETLADKIANTDPSNTLAIATTFFRVGWAVHHGLLLGIVHKDLHPGNFIFEMQNQEWSEWVTKDGNDGPKVRVIDFGSALCPLQFSYEETFDAMWLQDLNRNYNGAFHSVAPEFFEPDFLKSLQINNSKFDCWALGLLLYKLYTKESVDVANSLGEYAHLVHSKQLERKIKHQIDRNIHDFNLNFLVTHMLKPNASHRLSVWNANCYANFIRQEDPKVLGLRGKELNDFVFRMGCNWEADLPPHEQSNSPY